MPRRRRHKDILSAAQVAEMHEHSVSWFYDHWPELRAAGHPIRDALLGGWHRAAVQNWLDMRARLTAGLPEPDSENPYQAAIVRHAEAQSA